MSDWWTIIGTIASVSGGAFAWHQACRAKGYAKGLEDGKNDAKQKSTSKKLADINSKSKSVRNQISPDYIQGKTSTEIRTILEQYLTDLSDLIGAINGKCKKTLEDIYDLIEEATSSLQDDELKESKLNDIRKYLGQMISNSSNAVEKATFK